MNSSRNNRITIGILGAITLAAVGLYGYLMYGISKERVRTAEALGTLASEQRRGETLLDIGRALANTAAERQKIESYFVDIKGAARFLETLQGFGRQSGTPISLNSADVDKGVLRIDFSTQGEFEDIYRLVGLLETTPYVLEIKTLTLNKINITKGKQEAQAWSAFFSIRLLSFVNK